MKFITSARIQSLYDCIGKAVIVFSEIIVETALVHN